VDALTRIRYLTHHYQDLQGYRLLPFAAFFLTGALYDFWAGTAFAHYLNQPEAGFSRLTTPGVAMLAAFIIAALASQRIGHWYEQRYGHLTVRRQAQLSFSAPVWALLVAACLLPGLHSTLLGALGLFLLIRQAWLSPALLRHVPLSVLYLLLAFSFPGYGSGIVSYPAAGFNSSVLLDLSFAALLLGIALHNHRLLQRLRAPQAAAAGEQA
jgi:GAF domain-containing protein